MTNMQIISCIRFCIQLLITESIYTFAFERRKHFIIKSSGGNMYVFFGFTTDI